MGSAPSSSRYFERLHLFAREVARDPHLRSGYERVRIYARFDNRWHVVGAAAEHAPTVPAEALDACVTSAGVSTVGGQCFLSVGAFHDVVAELTPRAPDQAVGPENLADLVGPAKEAFPRLADIADNEFAANHDELTGIANRRRFNRALLEEVKRAAAADPGGTGHGRVGVWVIELDLDNFKAANDTFGHKYGDYLLQALAWRLTKAVQNIPLADAQPTCVIPARLGGEEFALLVAGPLQSSHVHAIAEHVRASIASPTMPDDREWERLDAVNAGRATAARKPDQRGATASVGWSAVDVSALGDAPDDEEVAGVGTDALDRADAAVYRAKNDGKNCTRAFEDIRAAYGTVLRGHPEAAMVAIDIGRSAGVRAGDTFEVYDKDFVGGVPFKYHDKRTERTRGTHPKRASGRVRVVPDGIEADMAFCAVERLAPFASPFREGARLRLVNPVFGTVAAAVSRRSAAQVHADVAERANPTETRAPAVLLGIAVHDRASGAPARPAAPDSVSAVVDWFAAHTPGAAHAGLARVDGAPGEVTLYLPGVHAAEVLDAWAAALPHVVEAAVGNTAAPGGAEDVRPAEEISKRLHVRAALLEVGGDWRVARARAPGATPTPGSVRFPAAHALTYVAAAARAAPEGGVPAASAVASELVEATARASLPREAVRIAAYLVEDGLEDIDTLRAALKTALDVVPGGPEDDAHRERVAQLASALRDQAADPQDASLADSAVDHAFGRSARRRELLDQRRALEEQAAGAPDLSAARVRLLGTEVELWRLGGSEDDRARLAAELARFLDPGVRRDLGAEWYSTAEELHAEVAGAHGATVPSDEGRTPQAVDGANGARTDAVRSDPDQDVRPTARRAPEGAAGTSR